MGLEYSHQRSQFEYFNDLEKNCYINKLPFFLNKKMIEYTIGISNTQNGTLQSAIIPIDPSKKYTLSGEALGLRLERKTKFYLGLNCLNENKEIIHSHFAWRIAAPIRVTDITSTSIITSDSTGTNLWQKSWRSTSNWISL